MLKQTEINASRIATYVRCPKRAFFSWASKPEPTTSELIIGNTIQTAYVYSLRKEQIPKYKDIRTWLDMFIRHRIKDEAPEVVYDKSQHFLAMMSKWYEQMYLPLYCYDGLVNLPVEMNLGISLTYKDNIPLVILAEQTYVCDFKFVGDNSHFQSYNGINVYNDFVARVHLWSFWKASKEKPSKFVRFVLSNSNIKAVEITVTQKALDTIEVYLGQICRGIQDGVFYPSHSEQCLHCPFVEKCSI